MSYSLTTLHYQCVPEKNNNSMTNRLTIRVKCQEKSTYLEGNFLSLDAMPSCSDNFRRSSSTLAWMSFSLYLNLKQVKKTHEPHTFQFRMSWHYIKGNYCKLIINNLLSTSAALLKLIEYLPDLLLCLPA